MIWYLLIGLIIGALVPGAIIARIRDNAPIVMEEKLMEDKKLPAKIYTIINSEGERETIMTSKSMPELLAELHKLSNNDQEN